MNRPKNLICKNNEMLFALKRKINCDMYYFIYGT